MIDPADVPVFVLAGGLGTRMGGDTEFRPKPMVEIGGRPILWHILKRYHAHGFRRFVVCAGHRSEAIKRYISEYSMLESDVRMRPGGYIEIQGNPPEDWDITVMDTGRDAMTGARIARAAKRYLRPGDEHLAITYGDGLTDADLAVELQFHDVHGREGTVLGVPLPSRFGEFMFDVPGSHIPTGFVEKPAATDAWINGGYFFFRRGFLGALSEISECVLEGSPLRDLVRRGELAVFKHHGFWKCMDTQRERDELEQMWRSGHAPWKNWEER